MASATIRHFVAVMPDGREYFTQMQTGRFPNERPASEVIANEAIRHFGITTKRADPQKIVINVAEQHIDKGELKRRPFGSIAIQPPLERMTQDEYEAEMTEILSSLPVEFHGFVRQNSWDHGHSSGFEEVINYAHDLQSSLLPAIQAYKSHQGLK